MSFSKEIYLGTAEHTIYSDEKWYLVFSEDQKTAYLEGRFQSDAPERTGYPVWSHAPCCLFCEGATALCRLPLETLPHRGVPNRFAMLPDTIWGRAIDECDKRVAGRGP